MVICKAIGELFNTTRNNITMHINEIYDSYELEQNSTSKKFLLVQNEGSREVKREMRKNKKMDENKKVYHLLISTGKWGVMKNYY